jgi:hypothetical protein
MKEKLKHLKKIGNFDDDDDEGFVPLSQLLDPEFLRNKKKSWNPFGTLVFHLPRYFSTSI